MDFNHSPRSLELSAPLEAFMDEHIYRNEARFFQEACPPTCSTPQSVISRRGCDAQVRTPWGSASNSYAKFRRCPSKKVSCGHLTARRSRSTRQKPPTEWPPFPAGGRRPASWIGEA